MNTPSKAVVALVKAGSTVGETATGVIDRMGYDFVTIDLLTSTVAAATNRPTVLKLAESDITDSTGYADITAFVGDGTGGFTIPSWFTNTATQSVVKMNVDCRTRKRYLKLSVSVRTTQDLYASANLFLAEIVPVTAAAQGTLVTVSG